MPSATPSTAPTTISSSVMPMPFTQHRQILDDPAEIELVGHDRQLRQRRRPVPQQADQRSAGRSRFSHFCEMAFSAAVRLGVGDDRVDLFQQRRLVLVHADVAGRVLDQELQLRALGRISLEDRRGHDVARRDDVDLAGQEGGDGAVVVLVALDRRVRRRDLGQFEILDRAARDADRLARQILGLADLDISRARRRR